MAGDGAARKFTSAMTRTRLGALLFSAAQLSIETVVDGDG